MENKLINKIMRMSVPPLAFIGSIKAYSYEYTLRQKIAAGEMVNNILAGSLHDFSITYLISSTILCCPGKIKEKYQLALAYLVPIVFTLNEYFSFLPHSASTSKDIKNKNDILAYFIAGTCAYITGKIVNYEGSYKKIFSRLSLKKKKSLENELNS